MLTFKNLNIQLDRPILKNVSGEIARGSTTFLIGPNGCGKTTLLKTLAQIHLPVSGDLFSKEKPIYFGANWNLQQGITGEDLFDIYNVANSPWMNATTLDFFEIKNLLKQKLEFVSSGERQRVLLCAVLFHQSPVVLLDEPLTFLDWNFSLKLQNILKEMQTRGRSFLIANHDLNWVLRFKDTQTWVLFQEQIYMRGSTQDVLGDIKLSEVFKIKTELFNANGRSFISISL